jgi:hypothetical protein
MRIKQFSHQDISDLDMAVRTRLSFTKDLLSAIPNSLQADYIAERIRLRKLKHDLYYYWSQV